MHSMYDFVRERLRDSAKRILPTSREPFGLITTSSPTYEGSNGARIYRTQWHYNVEMNSSEANYAG